MTQEKKVDWAFPYRIGTAGRTTTATSEEHVRSLIELALFTAQGERVNRPEFGAGVRQLVFSENAPELANSAQHLVHSALQRWLPGAIEVRAVDIQSRESVLIVTVKFRAIEESEERTVRIEREV